jgi:hypothetical protein
LEAVEVQEHLLMQMAVMVVQVEAALVDLMFLQAAVQQHQAKVIMAVVLHLILLVMAVAVAVVLAVLEVLLHQQQVVTVALELIALPTGDLYLLS